MPIIDQNYSTLANIRTKVRRLTQNPSANQMADSDIDFYINTFVLYDFPEQIRLDALRTNFTFYAKPFVDTYVTNTTVPTDPFYNFTNQFISLHPPLYIAGYNCLFSQSPEQFFGIYPFVNSISQINQTGDGVTTNFTGTLTGFPILQNNVLFSSVDVNNNGLSLVDDGNGNLVVPNGVVTAPVSTINYVTGAFVLNFPTAPAAGQAINSQTVPYTPQLPQAALFYGNTLTLRPVPDQPYQVKLEAFIRPTALLLATDMPGTNNYSNPSTPFGALPFSEWWQYIAYGAAKKIFEDRMDLESVQQIMPEFKMQQDLMLHRTIVQNTNKRTATIYTDQVTYGQGNNGWGWGGGGI